MLDPCWCYVCQKYISPPNDGICPNCNQDFLEYFPDQLDPALHAPADNQNSNNPQPNADNDNFNFRNIPGRTFQIVFGPNGATINGAPAGHLDVHNFINSILGRFTNPNQNMNMNQNQNQNQPGPQLGDFFLGSEEQLQALAERLFNLNQQHLGSPPAAQTFISSLQPVEYNIGDTAEDTCSICLEQLVEGDKIIILPCKHGFHPDCLSPWLKIHSECPCCRHKLPST